MDIRSRNQRKAAEESSGVLDQLRRSLDRVSDGGPVPPLLVLISGGGDSTALLLALAQALPAESLSALHVNYGLRGAASDADEAFCVALCARLGVELTVVHTPEHAGGNLQDWARDLRYTAADRRASELGADALVATAHTADDQAETILYRLFASPGRRALRGIPERRGRIIRPLLGLRRAELREWLECCGETWREDASNADPRFARVRARELLARAEELHPAAFANLLQTAADLREEGAELAAVVVGLTDELTTPDGALDLDALAALPPALGGAVLRSYVEQHRPLPVPKASRVLSEALRLGRSGAAHELQFEGARLAIQRGRARVIVD